MLFESSKQTAAASAGAASFHCCFWENWNELEFGTEIKSWIMRCQTVASPSSIRVGIHVLYLYTISSTCWLISKAPGKGLLGRPKLKSGQEQTGSEVWSPFQSCGSLVSSGLHFFAHGSGVERLPLFLGVQPFCAGIVGRVKPKIFRRCLQPVMQECPGKCHDEKKKWPSNPGLQIASSGLWRRLTMSICKHGISRVQWRHLKFDKVLIPVECETDENGIEPAPLQPWPGLACAGRADRIDCHVCCHVCCHAMLPCHASNEIQCL